jgi:hypothetical protein
MIFLVMVIGLVHGLVFLPVMLILASKVNERFTATTLQPADGLNKFKVEYQSGESKSDTVISDVNGRIYKIS